MLIREGLPEDVMVVTSRAFLQLGEQAGYLADADAAWARIAALDRRANPVVNYQVVQGTRP